MNGKRLTREQQEKILRLRRTTRLNLATIGARVGTSRSSVQRVCEAEGLGNIGLKNKTKTKPNRKPKTTSAVLSSEEAVLRLRIRQYKQSAHKRGLPFELTDNMCAELFTGKCYYCGTAPELLPASYIRQRDGRPIAQNGIDRKDSQAGYVRDNCVSACTRCNLAKGTMSEFEFIEWAKKVAVFQFRKELSDAIG